jgi:AcrR family transcriptional regulator
VGQRIRRGDPLAVLADPRSNVGPDTRLKLIPVAQTSEDIPTRLKRAASELFAAGGPDGTTVDEIARSAGVNRERVYAYFGGKDGLFATVLGEELLAIAEAVPLDAASVAEIGAFAGKLFDYHSKNPQLHRLLQWEALTFGSRPVPDEVARREHYQQKVDVIARAQRDGTLSDEIPPGDLLFLLIAIAAWWTAVPQIMRMTERGSRTTAAAIRRRRASAVRAAELLAFKHTAG